MKVIQSASLASKPEALMSSTVSPLAPTDVPEMPAIAGVRLAAAAARGYIDDVIDPRDTRARLIDALRTLRTKRDRNPPRKHGNIPL